MEDLERSKRSVGNALELIFADIAATWEQKLASQKGAFAQERQKLLREVDVLKTRAIAAETLLKETEHLRNKLENANNVFHRPCEITELHNSVTSRSAELAESKNEVNAPSDPNGRVIAYEEYERVRDKCEAALRQLELQKLQGGQYKAALARLTLKHNEYKEKFKRCKAAIKSWQEYADTIKLLSEKLSREDVVDATTPVAHGTGYSETPAWPMSSNPTQASLTPRGTPAKPLYSVTSYHGSDTLRAQPSICREIRQNIHLSYELNDEEDVAHGYAKLETKDHNDTTFVSYPATDATNTIKEHRIARVQIVEEAKSSSNSFKTVASPQVENGSPIPPSEKTPIARISNRQKELPSSQATEDEEEFKHDPAPLVLGQNDVNDDEPTVVSIRPVKRKRQSAVRGLVSTGLMESIQSMNGSSKKPFTIKHEDSLDTSFGLAGVAALCQEHSLDLDEVPGDVETPRKRRLKRVLPNGLRHGSTTENRSARATSMPLEVESLEKRLSDSFEAEIKAQPSRSRLETFHGHHAEHARASIISDLQYPQTLILDVADRDMSRTENLNETNVLQPINLNKCVTPRAARAKARLSSKMDQRLAPIHDITEDGEGFSYRRSRYSHPNKNARPEHAKSVRSSDSRLGNLLEAATPDKHLLSMHGSVTIHKGSTAVKNPPVVELQTHGTGIPNTQEHILTPNKSATLTKSRLKENSPVKAHSIKVLLPLGQVEHDDSHVGLKEEPLRARPVERLNLDDFKINPNSNQGLNFAFAEVVRNQEQRRCLPGCTQPECCGDQFRRMVQLGGALPVPPRGLWESSPPENENQEGDRRLLQAFLGNDCDRLDYMSLAEKAELLITAKAEQLARKHGKHRQAFERSTTPPGFWRTDMPTTQETEEDRKRLREVERRKVEERYLEARKTNGRWLFRDE